MNWKRLWQIARWEYLQKVRSKSFIISLFMTPALIVLFSVLPTMLADKSPDTAMAIALVDSTHSLYPVLQERLGRADTLADGKPAYVLANPVPNVTKIDEAIAAIDKDIRKNVYEGAIVVRDSAGKPRVSYRSENPNNIRLIATAENIIEEVFTERRLAEAGIDTAVYNRLSQPVDIATVKVTEKGGDNAAGFLQTFFSAYVGIILFMLLILTTGQSLVRSLVEEKSNRIMELLVSSGTPQELMWGKLLGLTGLGLTQVASWVLLGLLAVSYFALDISPQVLAPLPFILLYLILGYFLYAAIFIGIGSLVTTEQEAQMVTQYITMFLVAPMAFAFVVIQSPDASYIQSLSYFPLLTPSLMMLRIVVKMPPMWEILATSGVLLVSTTLVIWGASKIFRTAILMYGKRPSMREIVRWMRAS